MKLISQYLMTFGALLCFSMCHKSFRKINTDPNAISEVGAETLLPEILRKASNTIVGEGWAVGNLVVQQTAKFQFVNVDRYNWGDMPNVWNAMYDNLRNIKAMEQKSIAANQESFQAVAMILRSWTIAQITDLYGDCPYSKATQADVSVTLPEYDMQEKIYQRILEDLSKANTLLSTSKSVLSGDILYKGNLLKWRKFANSLRVRYLMRISGKKDVTAALQAIVGESNKDKAPIFESNADNAVYKYMSSQPNQYPVHRYRSGSFDELRLSRTMHEMLTVTFKNDPRLKVFSQPTEVSAGTNEPKYQGMPNGLAPAEALAYNGGSNHISKIGASYYKGAITDSGIQRAKGYFMGYAELQFLLAEACEKSLLNGSNGNKAKTYYDNGIKAAFEDILVSMPSDYCSKNNVKYSEDNRDKALEQIGNQLWIALFNTGFEAYAAWRRMGIPDLRPSQSNLNGNRIPSRFLYPITERTLNKSHYEAAVARQGTDDINTKIWWQK